MKDSDFSERVPEERANAAEGISHAPEVSDFDLGISSFFTSVSDFFYSLVTRKNRLSICAGLFAGLAVLIGFLLFDAGKEEWMLRQKYPEAINANERKLLYSQDLISQGRWGKAEGILRQVVNEPSHDATHADALLLLAQAIETGSDDEDSCQEARGLYQQFLTDYSADQRIPLARMRLAQNYARSGYFYESNAEYQHLLDILRDSEKAEEVKLLIARNFSESRNFPEAIQLLEQVIQASPEQHTYNDGRLLLGKVLYEHGERKRAISELTALIQEAPGSSHAASALVFLAQIAFQNREYEQAIAYCNQWLSASPVARDQAEVILLYGRAQLEAHEPSKAADAASDILTFFPQASVAADAYVLRGKALEALDRIEDAASTYQEATGFFPENPLPYKELARLRFSRRETAEAIRLMQHVCRLDPQDDEAAIALAKMYLKNGENVKAIDVLKSFTRMRQLSPRISEAFFLLAEIEADLNQLDAANDALERLLSTGTTTIPKHEVYERQGDLFMRASLYNEALDAYRRAQETSAKSTLLALKIARTLFASGNRDEALRMVSAIDAKDLLPADRFDFFYLQARIQAEQGDAAAARRLAHKAIALKTGKENFAVLAFLMHLNLKLNDDAEAGKVFEVTQKLIAMENKEAPFEARKIMLDRAGRLYEKQEYVRAAAAYSSILKPQFPSSDIAWAACQRGNCFYKLSRYSKARSEYSRVEEEFPASEYVPYAKQQVKLLDLLAKETLSGGEQSDEFSRVN